MFEEYFFEKQRVINIFAQFHMRIEFSLKSIGYNNFNEQMMISEYTKIALTRRRFLVLLAGVTGLALWRERERKPRERSLHEADFYRPHNLAG